MTWILLASLTGCGWFGDASDDGDGDATEKKEGTERRRTRKGRKDRPSDPFVRPSDPCARQDTPVEGVYTHRFGGKSYDMPLYIGASDGPRSMIVLLHGGRGGAPSILKKTRLHEKALDEGFAVVAPYGEDIAGKGARWNTGKFDDDLPKGTTLRDDVAFLDSLAAALRKDACVDNLYTFGFSSGGQMANRWTCEGKEVDGAIAAAGSLLVSPKNCQGPRAFLAMVGTRDDMFRHGPKQDDPNQLSTPDSLRKHWGRLNKCSDKSSVKDVGDATCTTLKGCKVPTQLCVVNGMPHDVPSPFSEKHPTTFDGPTYGWDFLKATE